MQVVGHDNELLYLHAREEGWEFAPLGGHEGAKGGGGNSGDHGLFERAKPGAGAVGEGERHHVAAGGAVIPAVAAARHAVYCLAPDHRHLFSSLKMGFCCGFSGQVGGALACGPRGADPLSQVAYGAYDSRWRGGAQSAAPPRRYDENMQFLENYLQFISRRESGRIASRNLKKTTAHGGGMR